MMVERRRRCGAATVLAALLLGPAVGMAQEVDPDWPCIQRKMPELTAAQMWQGPPPPEDWQRDAELRELARGLAARRVSVEEAAAVAASYAEAFPASERPERLSALFAAVLARINAERGEIIGGIGRYARRQAELAQRIETTRQDLATLEAAPAESSEAEPLEELRTALAWETRIFRERAQSLTYVCETPVLLERRAFEIARALAGLI